jgi:hypothetical protein
VLTTSEGGILGQGVALVSSSVSLLHLRAHFHCKTLLYQNLNKNCNILYLEHLIYGLCVCTCVFLLRQESFDMILVNNPSFYDGGVTQLVHCVNMLASIMQHRILHQGDSRLVVNLQHWPSNLLPHDFLQQPA